MYEAIGRLAPGATLDQARQDMAAVAAGIARENPDSQEGWGATIVPAHEQVVGDIGSTLWVLFGAVVLVLVIACANIANILLARSARASRDFAVRAAFGAGRWTLLRRSLVESAVLTAAGVDEAGTVARTSGRVEQGDSVSFAGGRDRASESDDAAEGVCDPVRQHESPDAGRRLRRPHGGGRPPGARTGSVTPRPPPRDNHFLPPSV
jgi:hypothetical protein